MSGGSSGSTMTMTIGNSGRQGMAAVRTTPAGPPSIPRRGLAMISPATGYAQQIALEGLCRIGIGDNVRRLVDVLDDRQFEKGVEVLFKAFEGTSFSHIGKYYTIPPEVPYRGYTLKEITLIPAPERLPVECWQPIQSG